MVNLVPSAGRRFSLDGSILIAEARTRIDGLSKWLLQLYELIPNPHSRDLIAIYDIESRCSQSHCVAREHA